jgi:hypothetical protein
MVSLLIVDIVDKLLPIKLRVLCLEHVHEVIKDYLDGEHIQDVFLLQKDPCLPEHLGQPLEIPGVDAL